MIPKRPSRQGWPALVAGAILLGQVAAARFLFRASEEGLELLGKNIGSACLWRERFGLPCPSCGLTRSIVLAAHGELADAFRLNPAGPLAAAGAAFFGLALLAYAVFANLPYPHLAWRWAGRLRRAGLGAAVLAGLVWLGHWVAVLIGVLPAPR